MQVMDAENTRALLERHSAGLKKSLGQNFLTDDSVAERIAAASGADADCGVLEIGPGAGALTAHLARRAGRVAAVEIDRSMLPVLGETLAEYGNVTVIHGDAVTADLGAIVRGHLAPLRPIVCANLPYQITTQAVRRLLASRLFESVTVMVQREAALRFAAAPRSAAYNETSMLCSYFSVPEILFDVPPGCFSPPPHVMSTVIRFDMRPAPADFGDELFIRLARAAFGERRKKFSANLARAFGGGRDEWEDRLESLGFPRDVRGERLSAEDMAALARAVASR